MTTINILLLERCNSVKALLALGRDSLPVASSNGLLREEL